MDTVFAIEGARNGGDIHTGFAGDIFDGDRHKRETTSIIVHGSEGSKRLQDWALTSRGADDRVEVF
jgi:hypothetical protein